MSSAGRATRAISSAVAFIALFTSQLRASAAVSPVPEASPAYIFLEMPATPGRGATEWTVVSMSYDADAGISPGLPSAAAADAVNVRGTLVLAKADRPSPLLANLPYAALEIVESDASRKPLRRLTFRHVRVVTIEPDGDEPAERVRFTARSVVER